MGWGVCVGGAVNAPSFLHGRCNAPVYLKKTPLSVLLAVIGRLHPVVRGKVDILGGRASFG